MTVTDHALRVIEVYPVSSLLLKFLVYACTHAPCTMQPHDSDSSCVQPRTTVAVQHIRRTSDGDDFSICQRMWLSCRAGSPPPRRRAGLGRPDTILITVAIEIELQCTVNLRLYGLRFP